MRTWKMLNYTPSLGPRVYKNRAAKMKGENNIKISYIFIFFVCEQFVCGKQSLHQIKLAIYEYYIEKNRNHVYENWKRLLITIVLKI